MNDPVLPWLQGGPGGSSLFGLFVENGPVMVDKNNNCKKIRLYNHKFLIPSLILIFVYIHREYWNAWISPNFVARNTDLHATETIAAKKNMVFID